jgi:hypothetical protein
MATASELVFIQAVRAAEGTRQTAKVAALATYAFVPANLAAYMTALEAADNAYMASLNSAASTLGSAGFTIPNSGTPNPGNVSPGNFGFNVASAMSIIGNGTASMGALC